MMTLKTHPRRNGLRRGSRRGAQVRRWLGNPRRFGRLARRIRRTKPIVCVKAGRTFASGR